MRDFGEVAERPGKPDGERLGLGFIAPLHAPEAPRRIPHGHAGLRSDEMLGDELKRRFRYALRAARTEAQVRQIRERGLTPYPVARCQQQARARTTDAP